MNLITSKGIDEDSVLDLRVVKSKFKLTSVGHTTVTSTAIAQKIIEEIHDRSPFNLSVKFKYPDNGNLAGHIDLPAPNVDNNKNAVAREKTCDNSPHNNNDHEGSKVDSMMNQIEDKKEVFTFNNPIILSDVSSSDLPLCFCGEPSDFVCRECIQYSYCSRSCQMTHWSQGHQQECVHTQYAGKADLIKRLREKMKASTSKEQAECKKFDDKSDTDSDEDSSPFMSLPASTPTNVTIDEAIAVPLPSSSSSSSSGDSGRGSVKPKHEGIFETINDIIDGNESDSIDSKDVTLPGSTAMKSSNSVTSRNVGNRNSTVIDMGTLTYNPNKSLDDDTDSDSDDSSTPFPISNIIIGGKVNGQQSLISSDTSEDQDQNRNKVHKRLKKRVNGVINNGLQNQSFDSSLSSDDVGFSVRKVDMSTDTDNIGPIPSNWTPVSLLKTVGYDQDTYSMHVVVILDTSTKPVLANFKVS